MLPLIASSAAPACLTPDAPGWPRALDDLSQAPAELHVRGTLPTGRAVAIVGTRAPDPQARDFAHTLAAALAREGVVVVSGGALGIDAAAHRGALSAGGRTVAVLANGVERAYPPEHAPLFAEIAAQGALAAEVRHAAPTAARFVGRNRIIAALAEATIVVQAPARSGALSTAAAARRLGRFVFAVPASPWDRRGAGCAALLRGTALPCSHPNDVLATLDLPVAREAVHHRRHGSRHLSADAACALAAMSAVPRDRDALADATGLDLPRLQLALLELLLAGEVVERRDGGFVTR
ncbi:MAG: DNA-processing protein DprA [Myxococcales bacterium]|nr:DNA-processing protein DprA [Myxococcales bacterium]